MLPDPRRFLEKLAEREQAAWAQRARHLHEGPCTLTTHYSVYAVSDGALARMHTRFAGARTDLHAPDAGWLLMGFLRVEPSLVGHDRRFELVLRGRKGDKAVFWKPGMACDALATSRFIITSRLAEEPRRVQIRPRSSSAAALSPREATQVLKMPPPPRVPAELTAQMVMTPTGGVFAVQAAPVAGRLPKTTPPPRRTSYPPPAPSITPLRARPAMVRLPLPSLRTFASA